MQTKIMLETEDQAMDDNLDAAAEAKRLKVSGASRVARERTEKDVELRV